LPGAASIHCATKFAVTGWSEPFSLELSRFGIHATVVHPGTFRTHFLDRSSVGHADLSVHDYADAATDARAALNHNQLGDPIAFGRVMVTCR